MELAEAQWIINGVLTLAGAFFLFVYNNQKAKDAEQDATIAALKVELDSISIRNNASDMHWVKLSTHMDMYLKNQKEMKVAMDDLKKEMHSMGLKLAARRRTSDEGE